ncbi:MAG TPA: hypothetical protein DIT25_04615 [Candidatus Moranbacteria bacterium]|nr:hypothetical protein [Candidatus Moranbacteria bacterium]
MSFNLVNNIEYCFTLVRDSYPLDLIYYSHIPAATVSLIVSLFVFLKNKKALVSKILLSLSMAFSIWVIFNLILWTSSNSTSIMFFWSFSGLLIELIFILSLYLTYVFINKGDVGVSVKTFFLLLLLPAIFFTPTNKNLTNFSIINDCEATEGYYFILYFFSICVVIFFWVLIMAILKYRKVENSFKKQLILFVFGIEFFLLSLFIALFTSSITENYELEFWGVLSMAVFMAFLAYLIVKFKAFNIKMLAAQALVAALIILVGSMFFFVETTTAIILTAVTLFLTIGAGWALVRAVKVSEERKEQLQGMSDKLAEANDQLRKLDNAKSEFISIASHQLRTPLTAIKGFISMLLEGSYGKVDPKQQDVLNKVYTSNERLVNLVEDLLNVSRMESGRMEFKFAPWSVEKICADVMDTFIPKAKANGLYLEYKKSETPLPEVMIDGTKVREVISNMVDNALKYTPKGGVTLRLEQIPNSKFQIPNKSQNPNDQKSNLGGQDVIRITVADTGIGVPQTELPYLFAKFSRGKDTSRLNTGGTGLGLYVGRSMVENNGGKIWAESDGEGKGSRFIIEIPIQQTKELLERWG